jgi:GTPase
MASIFTFDPDPPRLESPWLAARQVESPLAHVAKKDENTPIRAIDEGSKQLSVTRLDAEPQEGPIEYKLHLLLRPRRRLLASTTRVWHAGSQNIQPRDMTARQVQWPQYSGSRQHRLEQLTTQLLWRLQQSSPYHSSSSDNLIIPALPEATVALQAPQQLAKLLPGLEESKGALYEIGVADNGSLVGLTHDELDESLNNLRAMAASIGCDVRVIRTVEVGDCEYEEDEEDAVGTVTPRKRKGKLLVAEAYVKPILDSRDVGSSHNGKLSASKDNSNAAARLSEPSTTTSSSKVQLRVSLTGATTSGKSSLLGTLTTSTLDNGRGKSRLSLLKHRHEIASGMTSSVAQELLGYSDLASADGAVKAKVVNYATGNVSSWDDIHASSTSGRLAFICDSAGHPRFRRTTVRGLVGWAPHWTLMCIAADTSSDIKVQDSPTLAPGDDVGALATIANVAMAHLDLCLKLELPLVVVITKFDVATRQVRQILSDVLTQLKNAGRTPIMLPNGSGIADETELQSITKSDEDEVTKACKILKTDYKKYVPVLFTSAVRGIGIGKLHALLRHLPVPQGPVFLSTKTDVEDEDKTPATLFHIDDTFNLSTKNVDPTSSDSKGFIISGHLSSGHISIGDELQLGPFSWTPDTDDNTTTRRNNHHDEPFLSPRSFGEALNRTTALSRSRHSDQEWLTMRIISIRNLRLPVRELQADQAGTIGIVPVSPTTQDLTIRKGMVLACGDPRAAHAFTAAFSIEEANAVFVGSIVIVYTATVRAAAKVVAVSLQDHDPSTPNHTSIHTTQDSSSDDGLPFSLDEELIAPSTANGILVTFQFLTYREYVQKGAKVLVMPGGSATSVGSMSVGQGIGMEGRERSKVAGLEGFVGRVVERFG